MHILSLKNESYKKPQSLMGKGQKKKKRDNYILLIYALLDRRECVREAISHTPQNPTTQVSTNLKQVSQ